MFYHTLSHTALRQLIDSSTIWREYLRTSEKAKPYEGGMYWKKEGAYEYLVKTFKDKRQQRISARIPSAEIEYNEFHKQKACIEGRRRSLFEALTEAQRLNKAVRVGRVPDNIVSALNAIHQAGLSKRFIVLGTNALFAYETAAGVRLAPKELVPKELDAMGIGRKMLHLVAIDYETGANLLSVLQGLDNSFAPQGSDGSKHRYANAKGFEVNCRVLRPEECIFQQEAFVSPVVSSTGRMATMRTVRPQAFIDFKTKRIACSSHAENFEGLESLKNLERFESSGRLEGRRDALQAEMVEGLLDEGLLMVEANLGT